MTSTNINYVATYFEFPELDKIHGEPTYAKLCKIKDQIKANALSVSSELGRGAHGHLGLVLTNSEYASITATRYIPPAHPGPLDIPALTVYHVETRIREDHKALIRVFCEVTDLHKAVIKQIVKVVYPVYIKSLRDRITNTIQADVPIVLAYLFTTYVTIEPEVFRERKIKVREI